VLFYDGYPKKGSCAAGGGHVAQGYMFNINYEVKSFCGFVDPPTHSGGIVPHSYGLKGASRGKSALSWSFIGTVPGVGAAAVNPVLTQAFKNWRSAVPALSFTQVNSGPDIAISVAPLGAPGPTGQQTLASTAPDGSTIKINSQATFGATSATLKAGQTSLLNVMTHEIGHALGLLHATTNNSIMFAFANNLEALASDDTAAIKALYGWQPQRKLQGGTEATPSICACGNTLVMVWRGVGDDHNIWISTSTDGNDWTPQRKFGDVGTIASPAIAWDGRRLWMVWRGSGDDQGLYYKTSTDFFVGDNPAQQNVKGVGSSNGPRIAIISNTPTLVWKGVRDDGGIYFTRFVGGQWQAQANIGGVGTGSSPAICADFGGGARLLWRGSRDDHNMYTTFSSPTLSNWQPQSLLRWTIPGNAGAPGTTQAAGTTAGPALAQVGNVIQAAWHGAKGDNGLWFTQLANDIVSGKTVQEWSAQANIPGVGSSDGPSIASFKGRLHMVWKGIPNDGGIYTSTV
jgi:hypothetical protein